MIMSSKLVKRILLGVFVFLIIAQFIRPSRKTPRVDPNSTFLALEAPEAEMASLIKTACYDCHSYETKYPWYANVAPVSWWIGNHVSEGRAELNFSDWGKYPIKKKIHKMDEAGDEVKEGHMPLSWYTWLHAGARLSKAQRQAIADYFEEVRIGRGSIPSMPEKIPEMPSSITVPPPN